MDFYRSGTQKAAEYFNSDVLFGLKPETVKKNKEKYGKNKITEKKKQSFFKMKRLSFLGQCIFAEQNAHVAKPLFLQV